MTLLDRLLGRPPAPKMTKAVTALGPWATGVPLSLYSKEPQEKAKAYLQAYKVGWFYKAGRKIADDIASLDWSVSSGDMEEDVAETVIPRPDMRADFDSLSPIDQFQRLLEAPVRDASGRVLVTGRQLLRKTQVRLDFAGAAAWFLEGADAGLPTAIYGISPARLWPSYSDGELIGWVMDRDSPSGGVPFSTDEILWFTTGSADNDEIWGTSVVESVYSQVPLTDLIARHTGDVLSLGGRLSGMLWPKDRALNEDEYVDAQRAWRNVASDPNAARRMLIFPEPMEWAQGAATPKDIGIPELSLLNRDEILTAFPISPYRLGVPIPGGLNSGEVRREDRKDYWEETIHPRADLLKETIQVGLVSRYEEAMGAAFDFDIDEPDMDDAPALEAKAKAYTSLTAIGLDPKETLSAVGLDHIKWLGVPAPAVPPTPEPTPPDTTQNNPPPAPQPPQAKGMKAREAVVNVGKATMADFLRAQQERIAQSIRETLPASKTARVDAMKTPDPEWWDGVREDRELAQAMRVIYDDAARAGLQVVADNVNRTVLKHNIRRVLEDVIAYGGARIRDINDRTLDALKAVLSEGVRRGYSISQLVDGVPAEGFAGVLKAGLDNGISVWSELRAETIARTETALSYNRAALDGYKEFNISEVEAIDGDGDEECADRNGQTFSVEDALAIEDHPNGTLDWVPVIDKAIHDDTDRLLEVIAAVKTAPPIINVAAPASPTTVYISPEGTSDALSSQGESIRQLTEEVRALKTVPPVVNIPAPIVNVPAPIVNVPQMKAPDVKVTVDSVRVTSMPDRMHQVVRDDKGKPTGSVESDIP